MREPGDIAAAFPRPGRVLKTILILIAAFAVIGAVIVHWAPGGKTGMEIFTWLAFQPDPHLLLTRPWTIITSGLLTMPTGIGHALMSLVGLYFLTPDLEKRWGGGRLLRFLISAVVIGNLFVLGGTYLPIQNETIRHAFSPPIVVGPLAAVIASTIAWTKENSERQIRFMFVLPMSGKLLFWITIGMTVLSVVFLQEMAEGVLGIVGGLIAGILFSGSPSPVRALWLRIRLGSMRSRRTGITVQDLLDDDPPSRPRTKRGSGKGPALRVVQGGLEEDLKNRKPPKDKRYLN